MGGPGGPAGQQQQQVQQGAAAAVQHSLTRPVAVLPQVEQPPEQHAEGVHQAALPGAVHRRHPCRRGFQPKVP